MARTAVTIGLVLAISGPVSAQPVTPIAPKRGAVSAGGTLEKALAAVQGWSGIPVETAGANLAKPVTLASQNDVPFWTALDSLAANTGHRIALGGKGQKVALVRHAGPQESTSVDGPFRVVVREVLARRDADTGLVTYEIKLDIHWEPRFPVFRIGNQMITAATDDKGTKLTATNEPGKVPTAGYLHQTTVKLTGIPRSATKIAKLDGTFTVTAAEKTIRFTFDDPFKTPASKSDAGVTATLARFAREDGLWEARMELAYPANLPAFESFESWLTDNKCRLVAPGSGKPYDPTDYELPAGGAKLVAVYRFKEDAAKGLTPSKGWTLEYETPSPLVEYAVNFSLKDIDLP
jgi:hypothetical protein